MTNRRYHGLHHNRYMDPTRFVEHIRPNLLGQCDLQDEVVTVALAGGAMFVNLHTGSFANQKSPGEILSAAAVFEHADYCFSLSDKPIARRVGGKLHRLRYDRREGRR